jgi:hypothetical protein
MEVLFEARQQIERLQAIDTELLEEIIVRAQLLARYAEMVCCQL